MAPEQEEKSGETDHRSDIYALGVVLYEMLTGERPAKDLIAPSRKVEIDVRIDEIVLRALEKEPEKCYQTAGELRTVLETMAEAPAMPSGAEREVEAETNSIMLFPGLVFQSRAAIRIAQVGWGLDCLAALGFLGSIPGFEILKGMFGFSGFFGLIGVAALKKALPGIWVGVDPAVAAESSRSGEFGEIVERALDRDNPSLNEFWSAPLCCALDPTPRSLNEADTPTPHRLPSAPDPKRCRAPHHKGYCRAFFTFPIRSTTSSTHLKVHVRGESFSQELERVEFV